MYSKKKRNDANMKEQDFPVTAAVRVLRQKKVDYKGHLFDYEEHGGTGHSAACLGVPEHQVIKTLVMEDENRKPLIVLMHGDCEVSVKNLARELGVKRIQPCEVPVAQKHSGYQVGGTSPFGTLKAMPVYAEASIFALARIYINGGKRGFLVGLAPAVLKELLPVREVHVALPR